MARPRDPVEPDDEFDDETVVAPDWTPGPDGTHVVPAEQAVVRERAVEEVEEVEAAPPRRPTLWPWLLALLLLVLGGVGAAFYLSRDDEESAATTTAAQRTEVPLLVGLREEPARERAERAGFETVSQRRESEQEVGVVLAQRPKAGERLEEGATIRITVSSGEEATLIPNVVGDRRDDAVAALEDAGFEAEANEAFAERPKGVVVAQKPAAGEELDEGGVVTLTVSKGPRPEEAQPVAVPDVVGQRSSDAVAALRESGLTARLVTVPSSEPAGVVVAQSPTAGAELDEGRAVRLNVSAGPQTGTQTTQPTTTQTQTQPPDPRPAVVPDAVGGPLADAARAFGTQGLKVSVQPVPSEEQAGQVVAQAQPAGTELERGSTVQLNVSMGPNPAPPASVPSVTGRQFTDARRRVAAAGFEVLSIRQTGSGGQPGVVLSQTPDGGASVPGGSLVILYVAA